MNGVQSFKSYMPTRQCIAYSFKEIPKQVIEIICLIPSFIDRQVSNLFFNINYELDRFNEKQDFKLRYGPAVARHIIKKIRTLKEAHRLIEDTGKGIRYEYSYRKNRVTCVFFNREGF